MSQYSSSTDGTSEGHKSILKKGRACVNCRRRKMKCDGIQPTCGSCARTGKAEDCEYTTGSAPSTSQKLEEQIHHLQTRLRHLQSPSEPHQTVILQQPYGPETVDRCSISGIQEPPRHISQRLLDIFLTHASQYGFFLHPGRFKTAVQFAGPVGHESRPSPSLLSTMYLLGIHFSQDAQMKRHEKTYFDLALQHISQDTLSTTTQPSHRLHVIQAEILLAHYFFANQRPMEGKYHSHSAYSLAIASGIHRMRNRNISELSLPPVTDDIEEGERVNAFWAVFCAEKEWSGVFNSNSNQAGSSFTGVQSVTPMPREIEDYETGRYRCERRNGRTLDDFSTGNEAPGETLTSRTLHVKAAFLFERGCAFSRTGASAYLSEPNNHPYLFLTTKADVSSTERNGLRNFRNLAINFKSSLPPFESWLKNDNLDIIRTAYVGMTLLDAALIRMHGVVAAEGDERARQQKLISAEAIFNNSIKLAAASWNFGFLNPIIGYAWREAFNVLFEELSRSTAQQSWSRQTLQSEDPLRRQLRKGVSAFAIYANSSRFIGGEVEEMTNILQGTVSY